MNKAIYKVTTTDGLSRTLIFEEHPPKYNFGNHITISRDDEMISFIDMGYQNYVFETFCENYIRQYYGKTLLTYDHIS